ncbi:hypothetical protein CRX72_12780 [Pantoea sp. BRM17]|nr:hypothetical protein CRX72_12780 [Pantoea sp. BRM17]
MPLCQDSLWSRQQIQTLYTLVFIFAHHFWSVPLHMRHGQPELLLFLLPGVAIALLQPASPMVSTLWSAIAGTLLGMSWVMRARF